MMAALLAEEDHVGVGSEVKSPPWSVKLRMLPALGVEVAAWDGFKGWSGSRWMERSEKQLREGERC